MKVVKKDLWSGDAWRCITTNGAVRRDGACVMGAGCAKQAARLYPKLPYIIGQQIQEGGNHVYVIPQYSIITFPVKHHWRENADLKLIKRSCRELRRVYRLVQELNVRPVLLPKPGCGNGHLDWEEVEPVLDACTHPAHNIIVVDFP